MFQHILNYSDLHNQISILSINKYTNANLYVKNLSSKKIDQKTMMQHKFSKIEVLDLYDNPHVHDLNHLSETLADPNCGGYINGLSQKGIKNLTKLKNINIYDNNKIKCLKHTADTLEGLNCGGGLSQISQKNILDLHNLKYLNIYNNSKIVDLNHLKELSGLNCGSFYPGRMEIKQNGLRKLDNLKIIYAENNKNILQNNVNNIIVDNHDYVHSDIFDIHILDQHIMNDPKHHARFDTLKKQIIKLYNNMD